MDRFGGTKRRAWSVLFGWEAQGASHVSHMAISRHTGNGACPARPTALALPSVGSGVIYAVLVVMWAAYFIPRWLRRHEELSEARSVERFSRAMRILSRREPTPDRRYVVMPPRPADPAPATARRTRPSRAAAGTASRVPGPRDGGRRTYVSPTARRMALRRRRVLALLLLTLITVVVATPLSPLPWWAPLLALAGVVGWLVRCRLQARTRTVVSRTRQAAARSRSRSRLMRFDALDRLMAMRRELAKERAAEEARWQEAEEAMRREREAEADRERAAVDRWTPVPVPLPTYVTKPAAPRPSPPIDLTNPGAWTAAQAATTAATPPACETAPHGSALSALLDDAAEADDQLDAIIQRRAVND